MKYLNTNNRVTILSHNPVPGHISGKDKNCHSNRLMYPNIHSVATLLTAAKPRIQSKYLSTENKLKVTKGEMVGEE